MYVCNSISLIIYYKNGGKNYMKKFKLPYDSKTISLNLQNDNFARLL
ncbi:hypothetical protein [Terrisporobacter petrolearius]